MTHTGPMPESAGVLRTAEPTQCHCRKCDAAAVTVQLWESSCGSYEDYKYTCASCGHVWWVDGPDS